MTVGYFLDLLIINAIRKEKLGEALEYDTELDLDKQDGFLLIEIGKTLLEIAAGKKPGTFSKHKNYDKTIAEITNNNLIEVIYKLYQRHSELWDLEDLRRYKNNSDKARLEACDRVSIINKKRNDLVEMVDNIVNTRIRQTKLWGSSVD